MPKKRFTNEQIAFVLREAENGTLVSEIGCKMGVAEATFYRWKKVYAGMGVSERRTCQASGFGRASRRYESRRDPAPVPGMRLKDSAASRVRYGYRRLHVRLSGKAG